MSDRDDLAALIDAEIYKTTHRFPQPADYQRAADAILAAGWRAPDPDLCAHTSQSRVGDTSQWVCNQCGDVDERGGAYA